MINFHLWYIDQLLKIVILTQKLFSITSSIHIFSFCSILPLECLPCLYFTEIIHQLHIFIFILNLFPCVISEFWDKLRYHICISVILLSWVSGVLFNASFVYLKYRKRGLQISRLSRLYLGPTSQICILLHLKQKNTWIFLNIFLLTVA